MGVRRKVKSAAPPSQQLMARLYRKVIGFMVFLSLVGRGAVTIASGCLIDFPVNRA
jgi:hypothetical protein